MAQIAACSSGRSSATKTPRRRPPVGLLVGQLAAQLRRWAPQPLLGIILATMGLASLVGAWTTAAAAQAALTWPTAALAGPLTAAAVVAQLHPIHVTRGVKLSALTITLYLLAALTAPAAAAGAAAVAVLIGEVLQRREKGQLRSDIAATVGRTSCIVLLASLVAHATLPPLVPGALARLPLALAAGVLFAGDTLTVALELGAITGEHPFQLARAISREGGVAEGTQYLVGLLGALAAREAAWALAILALPVVLLHGVLKRGLEMQGQTRTLLEHVADTVDLRDPYTGGHSRRVTAVTAAILEAMSISGPEAALITAAARVHDIGKMAIPDGILNKEGRLTADERRTMESHAARGASFLARYPDFHRGIDVVRHHHERIDGQGYPDGLRGEQIPFGARVIAVADSFDAMTSDRPYRAALSAEQATAMLRAGRGAQWDERIVDAFVERVVPRLERERASSAGARAE